MTVVLKALPKMAEDLGRTTPSQRADYERRVLARQVEVLLENQRILLAAIARLSD